MVYIEGIGFPLPNGDKYVFQVNGKTKYIVGGNIFERFMVWLRK